MVTPNDRTVTVFGGTGFLGRRTVRHLRDRELPVRIASTHPDRWHRQFGRDDPHFDPSRPIFETSGLSRMRLPVLTLL
jgi:nucleoside-diphosphate-sugar epimerase